MKTHLLTAILSFIILFTSAQIPNSGFEDWLTVGNCMKPQGWFGTNDFDTAANSCGITRSTDHFPAGIGNYSLRLENNLLSLPSMSAYGICWSGGEAGGDNPAFALNGHPTALTGYYNFIPQSNDTMRIFISLYKSGNEVTQASLESSVSSAGWKSFNIPIPSYADADSARILISSFYPDGFTPQGNSVLYVDNLNFDFLITEAEAKELSRFSLFPNPANNRLTLTLPQSTSFINIEIYDILGQQIYFQTCSGNNDITLNTAGIPSGIYTIRIASENVLNEQKLIINR